MAKENIEIEGNYKFSSSPAKVWSAINDERILQSAIPGCEKLVKDSDEEFTATIVVKLGIVKARFRGKILLSDVKKNHSYRITGQGEGGLASLVKGSADVTLEDRNGATLLFYEARAHLEGKLARLGFRLVKDTAHRWLQQFFSIIAAQIALREKIMLSGERNLQNIPVSSVTRGDASKISSAPEWADEPLALHPWVWMPSFILLMGLILLIFAL